MISQICVKQDTTANWNEAPTPLICGELGYDIENKILKIGDGISSWSELASLGYCSDAGVTYGSFSGTNSQMVSLNVGSSPAKKIYISCMPNTATDTPKGTMLTVYYNAVTKASQIVYQGQDSHRVGSYNNSKFKVTEEQVTTKNGDIEYHYTLGFYATGVPDYGKFILGAKYNWFCITKDAPAGLELDDATNIAGTFIGEGTPTHTLNIGVDSVRKVYITCSPTGNSAVSTGTIYSLYYDAIDDVASITYQGADAGRIGSYSNGNFQVNIADGYLTIGFYSEKFPDYATFLDGAQYQYVVTTTDGYTEPSGSYSINKNGTFDVTSYAKVVVDVPQSDIVNIAGTFIGEGTPTHTLNIGVDSVRKVSIMCLPTVGSSVAVETGTIYSLYYDAIENISGITYQGGDAGRIGCYSGGNFQVSIQDKKLTIGFYSPNIPNYATFLNGAQYQYVVVA